MAVNCIFSGIFFLKINFTLKNQKLKAAANDEARKPKIISSLGA